MSFYKGSLVWVENDLNSPWDVSTGPIDKDYLRLAKMFPEQHKQIPLPLAQKLKAAWKALNELSEQADAYKEKE